MMDTLAGCKFQLSCLCFWHSVTINSKSSLGPVFRCFVHLTVFFLNWFVYLFSVSCERRYLNSTVRNVSLLILEEWSVKLNVYRSCAACNGNETKHNEIRKNTTHMVLNTPRLKGPKFHSRFFIDIWVLLIKFSRCFGFLLSIFRFFFLFIWLKLPLPNYYRARFDKKHINSEIYLLRVAFDNSML